MHQSILIRKNSGKIEEKWGSAHFVTEVTQYHDHIKGNLKEFPNLSEQLLDVPEALEAFTDKIQIIVSISELIAHLSNIRALYDTCYESWFSVLYQVSMIGSKQVTGSLYSQCI
jgi:hypothetical protein